MNTDKSLGKNAVFVRNEDAALKEMEFRAGCEVRPVCATPDIRPIYYISRKGKAFVSRPYKGYYVLYELTPSKSNGKTPIYYLYTDKGDHHVFTIERLVYCSFVLGEYKKGLKIYFKDGDVMNFDVSNLRVKNLLNEDCAQRMINYMEPYSKSFNKIVAYIAWIIDIPKEDAQDIVQDAFIDLLARKKELVARNFIKLWVHHSWEYGVNIWTQRRRFQSIDLMEYELGKCDIPIELDVLKILGDTPASKCLDLQLHGASMKEIADETGLSLSSIGTTLHRTKNRLRKYLLTDKEIYKIYA